VRGDPKHGWSVPLSIFDYKTAKSLSKLLRRQDLKKNLDDTLGSLRPQAQTSSSASSEEVLAGTGFELLRVGLGRLGRLGRSPVDLDSLPDSAPLKEVARSTRSARKRNKI